MRSLSITFTLTIILLSLSRLNAIGEVRVIKKDDKSNCYLDNRPVYCEPQFTNIITEAVITATSTCGQLGQTERICNLSNRCEECNSMNRPRTADHLKEVIRSSNNLTWISDLVSDREGENVVNITLSFGKNFEIYYLKLQESGKRPDAIAIYKSTDNGKEWKAWQYFSTDCYKAFGLPTSNSHSFHFTQTNIQEVLCDSLDINNSLTVFGLAGRTKNDSAATETFHNWITASDIKVSFIRFTTAQKNAKLNSWNGKRTPRYANESPFRFALANIEIGAKCKCNGHSSKCIRDVLYEKDPLTGLTIKRNGELKCDCSHNTDGKDCEVCKKGFFDLPWSRATPNKPFQCKECDCNLHSKECSFSQTLYLTSGMESGGVCENCLHNTVGRRCQTCNQGYHRDWTKPFSHELACMPCKCHEFGTLDDQTCNRKDGQCPCKPGVAGLKCDHCLPGYQQTNDKNVPCIKNLPNYAFRQVDMSMNNYANNQPSIHQPGLYQNNQNQCSCEPDKKFMGIRRFCRQHAVFSASIVSQEYYADSIRYQVQIKRVWRLLESTKRLLQVPATIGTTPDLITNVKIVPVWMNIYKTGPKCLCPDLKIGQTYLFVAKALQKPFGSSLEFQVDPKRMMVLQWDEIWKQRLNRLFQDQQRGSCNRFRRSSPQARMANDRRAYTPNPMGTMNDVPQYNNNNYYRNSYMGGYRN